MNRTNLEFSTSLDPVTVGEDFGNLFVRGQIRDSDLDRRVIKLSQQFKVFATTCHLPLWTNGLVVTDELSRVTETYLAYSGIRSSLIRLVKLSLKEVFVEPPLLAKADGWLRLLETLDALNEFANPGSLIAHLAADESERVRFLFSIYLPDRFGGAFGRYPGQIEFIREWVRERYMNAMEPVSCLDAACGSGEGSYELAAVLMQGGVVPSRIGISGVTLNPLEVFAAAHAYFPHAPKRESEYRRFLDSFTGTGILQRIRFRAVDLKVWEALERYQIIICNGVLGGPMMHENREVEGVVSRLAAGLEAGGVLLASDRFHGGWKKVFPREKLMKMFTRCGLELLPVSEGVAGFRRR